jgi:NAD-dependent dihydropyrimidine dehydrogenase PreA subunit
MRRIVVLSLATAFGFVTACGPNCQSTCRRLYTTDGCNIERPGNITSDQLIGTCMDACEGALAKPGDLGTYNPFEAPGSSTSVTLDNEMQAAIWMDCVEATACEDLGSGYCAPIW